MQLTESHRQYWAKKPKNHGNFVGSLVCCHLRGRFHGS